MSHNIYYMRHLQCSLSFFQGTYIQVDFIKVFGPFMEFLIEHTLNCKKYLQWLPSLLSSFFFFTELTCEPLAVQQPTVCWMICQFNNNKQQQQTKVLHSQGLMTTLLPHPHLWLQHLQMHQVHNTVRTVNKGTEESPGKGSRLP